MITAFTVHSLNNTGKSVTHPLNLTPDCCEVTVDTLTFGEINLEIPVKVLHPMRRRCDWQTTGLIGSRNL